MNRVNAHRDRDPADLVNLTVEEAVELGSRVLARVGYDARDSKTIVLHMIEGVWSGYPHTGLSRILAVIDEPRSHQPRSAPRIVRETPVSAVLDAGNTVGYIAAHHAMELTIAKARQTGLAAITFYNTYFTGRNSYYLEKIAEAGLVGIHAASTPPWVAPFGGKAPALGVNPIGFGFPCNPYPLTCDFGTASFMWGEIILHQRLGRQLPEGVAIDENGVDTTDPAAALRGAILPFGGHKGYTLNLAVQMLCMLGFQSPLDKPQDEFGFIFLAVNPDLFAPAGTFIRNAEQLARWVASIPARPGEEVRLPSSRATALRARNRKRGEVPVERNVYEHLLELSRGAVPVGS
jgi:LDH2 family malate/lactate/ureidoglycolate dehydrogenase